MKDYNSYTAADLATDLRFRAWVLEPTDEDREFWEGLIHRNPGLENTVREAAAILKTVHAMYQDDLTEEVQEQQIANLFSGKRSGRMKPLHSEPRIGQWWYKVAAVILIVGAISAAYFLQKRSVVDTGQTVSAETPSEMKIAKNFSGKPMTILLGDGSVIALEHGSTLRYPGKFEGEQRDVYLDGQAFFDIARDPARPFLVFSGSTVTRVLGTSFRIESDADQVRVAVKSGKVSVQRIQKKSAGASEGVFLLPNEQVVFHHRNFEKSLVKINQKITSDTDKQELSFDETAISEVFRTLERSYGIDIEFDESRFSACKITTQFTDETLRQRLKAICEVTGTEFKITDGQVLIDGSCSQ